MSPFDGRTRLDRVRDNVNVAAYAANYTAQVVEDAKLRSLINMEAFDSGMWKRIAAPVWHGGTPPRRIDLLAHRTSDAAIRRYKPEAHVTSEELEGAWDDSPGVDLFVTDPEDGTDNGRALGFADATVVLSFTIGPNGERIFNGGAISTASVQLKYTVYNRTVVEAQILIPPRGVHVEPLTSDINLMQSFDAIVPGDPQLIAALAARSKHRGTPAMRALLAPENPAWVGRPGRHPDGRPLGLWPARLGRFRQLAEAARHRSCPADRGPGRRLGHRPERQSAARHGAVRDGPGVAAIDLRQLAGGAAGCP